MKPNPATTDPRFDAMRLIKQSVRREMPKPVRIFRDRRNSQKANRHRYGSDQ